MKYQQSASLLCNSVTSSSHRLRDDDRNSNQFLLGEIYIFRNILERSGFSSIRSAENTSSRRRIFFRYNSPSRCFM